MPRIKSKPEPIREVMRLSSEVTVIVEAATPEAYDALDIQRGGGRVVVARAGALMMGVGASNWGYANVPPSADTPIDPDAIARARAALGDRTPLGQKAPEIATPASMGFPSITPESLTGGGGFAGISNEDDAVS